MLDALLIPTMLALPLAAPTPPPTAAEDPPIQLWINSDREFRLGEAVRVQVDTREAGYLLVMEVAPDGRVRVLFPLDPSDDASVEGGRRYEIRGEDDRVTFRAGGTGEGLVYAALSADPFRFDPVQIGTRWDADALRLDRGDGDLEAGLTDLVLRLTSPRGFDYDALPYLVYGSDGYTVEHHYYADYPTYYPSYCGRWGYSYSGCADYYGVFCYTCGAPGYYVGVGYYDPFYYPYAYPFGSRYYYPGYFGRPVRVGVNRPYTVLTGRSRGYGARQFGGRTRGDRFDSPRDRRFGDRIGARRPSGSFEGDGTPARRARPRSRPEAAPRPNMTPGRQDRGAARPAVTRQPGKSGTPTRARRRPPNQSSSVVRTGELVPDRTDRIVDRIEARPVQNQDRARARRSQPAKQGATSAWLERRRERTARPSGTTDAKPRARASRPSSSSKPKPSVKRGGSPSKPKASRPSQPASKGTKKPTRSRRRP